MNDLRDYYRDGDSETGEEDMFDTEEAGAGGDSYITDVSDAQYATDFAKDERPPPPYNEESEYLPLPNGRNPQARANAHYDANVRLGFPEAGGIDSRSPPHAGVRDSGLCYNACWVALLTYGLVRNVVVGILELVWQLLRALQKAGTFRVVPPDAMFSRKQGSTTATGGALVISILMQSWILTGMLYLAVAVGAEGVLAEAVEIKYLKYSTPALVSVPLGLYIFAWGGLQARTPTARNVMTVYGAAEICKAVGDVLNLFRYITLVHSRQHWSVLLTNEVPRWLATKVEARDLEKLRAEFQHGGCGEPHAIILILLVSIAVTTVLSFMNVSTVVWRNVSEDAEIAMAKAAASDSSESDEEDPHFASGTSRLAGSGRRNMPPRSGTSSRGPPVSVSEESSRAMIVKMLTRDN